MVFPVCHNHRFHPTLLQMTKSLKWKRNRGRGGGGLHVLYLVIIIQILYVFHEAPSVAPQISDVSSPTPTVISVTWKPPMYTNGQLLGYYLTLTPLSPQSKDKKLTIREVAPDITQWTFRQLKPGQVYLVNVSATNSVGKGPAGSVNITTPGPGNCK